MPPRSAVQTALAFRHAPQSLSDMIPAHGPVSLARHIPFRPDPRRLRLSSPSAHASNSNVDRPGAFQGNEIPAGRTIAWWTSDDGDRCSSAATDVLHGRGE